MSNKAPSATTQYVIEPGRQEMMATRMFDAPRARVFEAFTDAAKLARWWGPARHRTVIERMDARPGGTWRFVSRGADGAEFAFHGVFHEISAPLRIVQTFEFEGAPGHVSLDTATFEDLGARTRLVQHSVFQSVADRDAMVAAGMEEGATESMDRLGRLLAEG